jgi:peptide/nickel transport system permease protein
MKKFKYKKTIIGLSILLFLLVLSFMYPLYGPKDFNKVRFLYDQKGSIIGVAPLRPSAHNLLGSDRNGADILLMLVYGAKFTLLMSLGVTIFRVFFGGIFGIILSLWLKRLLPVVKDFLSVFNLVPPIIITLFLMLPVSGYVIEGSVSHYVTKDSLYIVLLYQMIVLVIMGIPTVLLTTVEVIEKLKRETFIQSSYLMGASHFRVLKTHLKPFLKSYGLLMTIQHYINTLVLIMFLGAFGIYIGGISKEEVVGLNVPNSFSKEWAGLIGQNYGEFYRSPWIVIDPLICYLVLILIINMIKKELETSMDINLLGLNFHKRNPKKRKLAKDDKIVPNISKPIVNKLDFTIQREH